MKPIKIFFLCLIICSGNIVYASSQSDVGDLSDLRKYVDDLIQESYKIVNNSSLSSSEKVKRSGHLIEANLYLDWMAHYTLGRNKRDISPDKIKEFVDIYSKFVVQAYASLVRDYSGERAVVKNISQIDENVYIVNTELVRPDSPTPVEINYVVHKVGKFYKIVDVVTEGVSILNSQQSEFNSTIASKGIDGLIDDLRKKEKAKE